MKWPGVRAAQRYFRASGAEHRRASIERRLDDPTHVEGPDSDHDDISLESCGARYLTGLADALEGVEDPREGTETLPMPKSVEEVYGKSFAQIVQEWTPPDDWHLYWPKK